MTNYNNGKIYKIECLTTGLIYVGSTTKEYLSQRLGKHRSDYKLYKKGKYHFITSFSILENENYIIGLLESVNCNTKDELLAREGHYIRILDCVNKCIIGRTRKEHYEDNKERILENHKQYYQDNIEQKKEFQTQYRKNNKEQINEKQREKFICECKGKYTRVNKLQHLKSIRHQNFVNSQI